MRKGFAPRPSLILAVAVLLAAQPASAGPLTEVPGERGTASGAPALSVRDELPPSRDVSAEAEEARAANPSATAIIRSLAPFADGNPGAPARPLAVTPADGGAPIRVDAARAVDLTVFFAYDSARLTPEARIQLEPLGQALRSGVLARQSFLIAGHTDAAGGWGYNRRLSLARARAVRTHLVATYEIDPARLRVHGWGPGRLKDPDAPLARVNRRVEVSLIAPRAASLGSWSEPVAFDACAGRDLADPRRRVALDLDDFDAAPTPLPCAD